MKVTLVFLSLIALISTGAKASCEPSLGYLRQNAVKVTDLKNLPDDIAGSLAHYKAITVGEMHGTNETPAFVYGMVRLLQKQKRSFFVALEIPGSEQKTIDQFLATGDLALLKASPFFTRSSQDGRSSKAMANLLTALQRLHDIKVYCFDPMDSTTSQDRDTKMARNIISEYKKEEKEVVLILAGNIHAAITKGSPFDASYLPMGFELQQASTSAFAQSDILAIKSRYGKGSAWICTGKPSQCKVTPLSTVANHYSEALAGEDYFVDEKALYEGYNASLFTRTLTASEPLVAK